MGRIRGAAVAIVLAGTAASPAIAQQARTPLRPAETFQSLQDPKARSLALFQEAGRVLTHPRCVNCHPVSDRPLQGDAGRPHQPPVFAGEGGIGTASQPCGSCHGASNFTLVGTRVGSIPGHPQWHLAPREMAWQGKALGEICRQIKDPSRNGGKNLAALHDHMAKDELVGWSWAPGKGREPAPRNAGDVRRPHQGLDRYRSRMPDLTPPAAQPPAARRSAAAIAVGSNRSNRAAMWVSGRTRIVVPGSAA